MIVALSLALGALVVDTGAPVEAQQSGGDGNADLPVGIPVPYIPAYEGFVTIDEETYSLGAAGLYHYYLVRNPSGVGTTFKVRTRVFNQGIAPAALKKAAKQVKVTVTSALKARKKFRRQGWGKRLPSLLGAIAPAPRDGLIVSIVTSASCAQGWPWRNLPIWREAVNCDSRTLAA